MKFFKKIILILFFTFIGYIYFHNLTRDVYGGDIGDLVSSAYVFGVAHPPGYPLFSLIGYIFSHLPVSMPVVTKVGLISVISSLVGLFIYYKYSLKVTKNLFISLLSTSILAFSYFYWLSAEIPEGLGLNNLFVIVILFLSIKFYEKANNRDLYLLALFIGLSLTHQLFIITLFPAVFILVIKNYKFIFSKKRFIFSLLLFLAGLSVYLYVPLAASRNPLINWDNAVNLKNFLQLVLRHDYGGITNTAKDVPIEIRFVFISHYLKTLVSVISYQILFIVVLGIYKILKTKIQIGVAFITGFLLTGVICFYYTAEPIFSPVTWGVAERYYSVSIIVLMFMVPYGLLLIKKYLDSKFTKPLYSYLILGYFLIIPLLMFKYNFPKTDLSKTQIGNNLAKNIFLSLPKNSILFVSGDNITFDVWYAQYVLKMRQDVDIINPPNVGNNIFLNREINDFYKNNPKADLKTIMSKTFDKIQNTRRIFVTNSLSQFPKGMILLPRGLVYEVIKKENLPIKEEFIFENEKIWRNIEVQSRDDLTLAEQNFLASEVPLFYSRGYVSAGYFLIENYNDYIKAGHYFTQAIQIDDTNSLAYAGLALSQYKNKNCEGAVRNIKYAVDLYPIWKGYYLQQYYYAISCKSSKIEINKIKEIYKERFDQDIEKVIIVK